MGFKEILRVAFQTIGFFWRELGESLGGDFGNFGWRFWKFWDFETEKGNGFFRYRERKRDEGEH